MKSSNIKKPSTKFCSSCLYSTSSAVSLEFDEKNNVLSCLIEAVISNRTQPINWAELKESEHWQQGWK